MFLPKTLFNYRKARWCFSTLSVVVLSVALAQPVFAYDIENNVEKPVADALKLGQSDAKYGKFNFDLRYRFEYHDAQGLPPQTAYANTLRLRAGYLTPKFVGLQAFAEFEGNWSLSTDYNSLRNGKKDYLVVADPEAAELNRLWLTFDLIPDTVLKGGRQRIKIDDDRFIGNVGWRQMEQTYDAFLVTNKSIPNLTIKAGYIGKVKTILSTTDAMTSAIAHANYKMGDLGNFITYGYWLDYDDEKFLFSSQTYGVRVLGSPQVDDRFKAHYLIEWSSQDNLGENPFDYSEDRWHLMGGVSAYGLTLKGGMEQLDGNGQIAFSTPLGTNHAFQGWADKFLSPVAYRDGLRDVYASLGSKVMGTKLLFVYHNFKDDTGKDSYGNEYDALITRKFGKHYHLLLKYAYYDADGRFTDTHKVWIQGGISF